MKDIKSLRNQISSLIHPWMISNWETINQRCQFVLQIIDPHRKSDVIQADLEAKVYVLFEGVDVTIPTINEWSNSTLPVILIGWVGDSQRYLPFDESYVSRMIEANPNFSAMEKFRIDFSKEKVLDDRSLGAIQKYVHNWRRFSHAIVEPGAYFELKRRIQVANSTFLTEQEQLKAGLQLSGFDTVVDDLSRAIYTISIVGPTKAGKSTIINSLVAKDVSPVDLRPTTGVPTNFIPDREEGAEIVFYDNHVEKGPTTDEFLKQYVSIDQNKGNYKKVKLVTVRVRSSLMEKGLAFCDVPGIDDADPEIEKIVENSLRFTNAIIYVMNAGAMRTGFTFPKSDRDNLIHLGKSMDKVFLVFNKIDEFDSEGDLDALKAFINEKLEDLGINQYLPHPPLYISAKRALANRKSKNPKDNDDLSQLETVLWNQLLQKNNSGLDNLLNICNGLEEECHRTRNLLQTRLSDGEKKSELISKLKETRAMVTRLVGRKQSDVERIRRVLFDNFQNEKEYLVLYYNQHLQQYNRLQDLPSDSSTIEYLTDQLQGTIPNLLNDLESQLVTLENELNEQVHRELGVIEEIIFPKNFSEFTDTKEFTNIIRPIFNIFSRNYGRSVPTAFLGNLFYHVTNFLDGAVAVVVSLFTNDQVLVDREIEKISNKLKKAYDEVFTRAFNMFDAHMIQRIDQIFEKIDLRTRDYLNGLEKQANTLSSPLSSSERNIFDLVQKSVSHLEVSIGAIKLDIEDHDRFFKPSINVRFTSKQSENLPGPASMKKMEGPYDIFLCHSSTDKKEVLEIAERLRAEGLNPWLDIWCLQPGRSWIEELERNIQNINCAAVFVGNSEIRPWQDKEIKAFLIEFTGSGKPIIPIVLPGVSRRPQLPLFLKEFHWVDFRSSEPDPMEQLIWGITGIRK